ncbi:Helicase associated domain protein [Streptomyces sp. P6-2-1]|uniref:helicase associated domain-containing protein n=1 Tax=Streptomyces sp. P6-2-1 TaxID=3422591 RepID=UPI003D360BE8
MGTHPRAGFAPIGRRTGTSPSRRRETWGEGEGEDVVRVGDLMANLRRAGGLGKDEERAAARAAQLRAVDADGACPWPLDWQRCYRQLVLLAADEPDGRAPQIAPGVRIDGDDLGSWVARQQEPRVWAKLSPEQRTRLEALGLRPAETAPGRGVQGTGTAGSGKRTATARAAFRRGLAAPLAQWVELEGTERPVPRKHVETVSVDGEDVDVRLGVWISNTKNRFDGLSDDERAQLVALGIPGPRDRWTGTTAGWYCLTEAYAEWLGSPRWLCLAGNHRALGDARALLERLREMANGKGMTFTPTR